jgi:hypothetical protein
MQITNDIIQLAKERALFGFSALAQQMLQDADERMVQLAAEGRFGGDQHFLHVGRQFIRNSGKVFLKRVEIMYRDSLERAMRTMYTDLRVALDQLSADNLALIDDETVNRQIEVDRVVLRLRDADDEYLRKLNLMIAQLHGDHNVRERENPFRPYLMARTLHQVLHDMVADDEVGKRLFGLLSDALANRLADFYASICEVFEAKGIHAQLLTQKSRHVRNQRYTGGNTVSPDVMVLDLSARVMPGLQRVLELMNHVSSESSVTAAAEPGRASQPNEFQDFVSGIFKPDRRGAEPLSNSNTEAFRAQDKPEAEGTLRAGSEALVSRLNQYQQQAARGQSVSDHISPEQNQLFAVREQMGTEETTKFERVAIDVVAMLFELILGDEQIPGGLRAQIGRLQIPFLKAAMLMPDMLQQGAHPARQLVNRMGSAAVALDPATPLGQSIEREITRIVHKILEEFDDDIVIFSDCLTELELFLTQNLRHADSETALSIQAVETAEQGALQNSIKRRPPEWLADFNIDQRIVEFIGNIWMRVLEMENADGGKAGAFRDLLPDLIWSVQEKQNPEERAALMRLLPTLVTRLKAGLALLQLPDNESQQALDQLVAVHTQVLRMNPSGATQKGRSLQELREHFPRVVTEHATAAPEPVNSRQFETELAKQGISIDLDLEREPSPSFESDADWLTRMQVGTCVERWSDTGYQLARLIWISKRRTLYMFHLEKKSGPIVYSAISLIKSLREGSVRTVEHAPIFERAVESLLIGARAVESNPDTDA